LDTDKTKELRLALSNLPTAYPDIDLFFKLCPHLSESQAKSLRDSADDFTLFAVPSPWNINNALILLFCAGFKRDEEDDEDDEEDCYEEEEDDCRYDPPRISIIDQVNMTRVESYYSKPFELNALFVKEAIDWQKSR